MLNLPDADNRVKKVQDMKELRKAFDEAKAEWKNVGGHIIIENSTLQCDGKLFEGKFDAPLVIRAASIGGCTIKGEGKFGFKDSTNLWLYGINFENRMESKGKIEN